MRPSHYRLNAYLPANGWLHLPLRFYLQKLFLNFAAGNALVDANLRWWLSPFFLCLPSYLFLVLLSVSGFPPLFAL